MDSGAMRNLWASIKIREKGNELFKEKNYDEAYECYTLAVYLNVIGGKETAVAYKNRAAVLLKQEKYADAVSDCTKALEILPNDIIALYQRSLAFEQLGRYAQAYRDAQLVLNVDPKSKAMQEVVQRVFAHLKPEDDDAVYLIRGKKYPAPRPDGSDTLATWKGPKKGLVFKNGSVLPWKANFRTGFEGQTLTTVIEKKTYIAKWGGDCYVCLDGTKIDSVLPDYVEGEDPNSHVDGAHIVPESQEQKSKCLEAMLEGSLVLDDTAIMDITGLANMVLKRQGNEQDLNPYMTSLGQAKDILRKGGIRLIPDGAGDNAGKAGDNAGKADGNNNDSNPKPPKQVAVEAMLKQGIVFDDTSIMDIASLANMVLKRQGKQQFVNPYITKLGEAKEIFRKGGIRLISAGAGDSTGQADEKTSDSATKPSQGAAGHDLAKGVDTELKAVLEMNKLSLTDSSK